MDKDILLETDRLILRRWKSSDLMPFSQLNADPKVMEYFPALLSQEQTEAMLKVIEEKFEKNGFCFFATELKSTQEFIGFVGLNIPSFEAHFTPCVEIGWRLAYKYWGNDYAVEAALASFQYGFETLNLKEIVAFTTVNNFKSRRVMEKLGMVYNPIDDFNHPELEVGHPLSKHVLYKKGKASDARKP